MTAQVGAYRSTIRVSAAAAATDGVLLALRYRTTAADLMAMRDVDAAASSRFKRFGWLFRWMRTLRARSAVLAEPMPDSIGDATLVLDEEGLEEVRARMAVRIRWHEVTHVARSVERTIVVSLHASIAVPVSAFPHPHARLEFERLLETHRRIDGMPADG